MQTRRVTETGHPVRRHTANRRRIVRSGALTVVAVLSAVTLSSCSTEWASMSRIPTAAAAGVEAVAAAPEASPRAAGSGASSAPASTAPATSAPSAAVVVPAPSGDLATGSVTHVMAAGAAQLAVDYWTTDAPASLGSAATTTVQLSAHLEGSGARAETRVSRFRATAVDGGAATGGGPAVLLDDGGSFSITAPYSYSTVVDVPTRDVGTSTTVRMQWDLLVETYPRSNAWFRQTVVDQVVIGLPAAAPAATASPASTSPTASPASTTTSGARS